MTIMVDLDGRMADAFRMHVAFELPLHGVTALVGASGSGKTSLLRAIAGLVHIAGTIHVGGETWQNGHCFLPPEARRVGLVFQGLNLLPHLSVATNLDYACRRAPAGPFDRAVIIERAGIAHLLDRRPGTLSGGEAQRAGIARALLGQPRLLLMDEPLSALDADAREEMLGWIEALLDEVGLPTIYVTHDRAEAARLASRTIRLADGRLQDERVGSVMGSDT